MPHSRVVEAASRSTPNELPAPDGTTTSPPPEPVTVLTGDVRHVRLPSLLQLCEAEMLTGRIVLESGEVALRSGAVVAARSDHGLDGIAAMRELFLVAEGPCRIELDASQTGQPLAPTISLVLDGCKLVDEWNELAGLRFAYARQPTMLTPALSEALAEVRAALDVMQAGATLAEAARQLGAVRSALVPHLMRLFEAGVIQELLPGEPPPLPLPLSDRRTDAASPSGPPSLPPVPDDLDELVTRARAHARRGELDLAEHLLRAAIERHPNDRVLAQNLRHVLLRRSQQQSP